jgi:hypothetical protein
MLIAVVKGEENAWTLAALPALLFLTLFSGIIGFAGAYFVVTGRAVAEGRHDWPRR